jgi:hypothetical protein
LLLQFFNAVMKKVGRQKWKSDVRENEVEPRLSSLGLFSLSVGLDPVEYGLEDDLLLTVRHLQIVVGDQVNQMTLAYRNEFVTTDNLILLWKLKHVDLYILN